MINGVTTDDLLHSGCRNNLHFGETSVAFFSAHSKSLLLNTTTFNSSAVSKISGVGALNFFGEKQIQSQSPLNGLDPDVSICVLKPALRKDFVSCVQSCMSGSPPVMMAMFVVCGLRFVVCGSLLDANCQLPTAFLASFTISSIVFTGCLPASQLSLTSHQTQPTSQPPSRMK